MRNFIIFVIALAAISLSSAYTDTQQAMITGVQLSWEMSAANAAGNTQAYNDLIPAWNEWVRANFGEDTNLLVRNQTIDLSKPYVAVNNSANGIVHQIDGSSTNGTKYTTNDANALPDRVRYNASTGTYSDLGGAWLGGI